MKEIGMILILLSILGVLFLLVYKTVKKTIQFIGPKSLATLVICEILMVIGILFLLRS